MPECAQEIEQLKLQLKQREEDPGSGSLKYANCGHMPPLLVNAHGDSRALNLTGPAVEAIHDADFVVLEETLRLGELLFSDTDGLTDAENVDGEHFSPASLLPLLPGGINPSKLLENIQNRLNEFTLGAGQFDDIAMLAVSRKHE